MGAQRQWVGVQQTRMNAASVMQHALVLLFVLVMQQTLAVLQHSCGTGSFRYPALAAA